MTNDDVIIRYISQQPPAMQQQLLYQILAGQLPHNLAASVAAVRARERAQEKQKSGRDVIDRKREEKGREWKKQKDTEEKQKRRERKGKKAERR